MGRGPRLFPGRLLEPLGNQRPRGMITTRKRTEPGLQSHFAHFIGHPRWQSNPNADEVAAT